MGELFLYNDKINYGKIIKSLRIKHKLTQSELGDRISVGKTAISNYETGYSIPSAHILEDLASIFDMTLIEFLSYGSDNSPSSLSTPRLSQPINDKVVPYIKEANINESSMMTQKYMDSYLSLPMFMLDSDGDYICIKMPDDSMHGDNIQKNDYIIVRKSKLVENHKIVLAIHKQTGVYMIRRYVREGHIAALIPSSASPKHNIFRSDERDGEFSIIGYVEKVISSVK